MYASRIQLENIRCYQNAAVNLSPGINLLAGENNSGKSTILHALYSLQAGVIGPDSVRFGALEGDITVFLARTDAARFHSSVRDFVRSHNTTEATARFVYTPDGSRAASEYVIGTATVSFAHFPNAQPDNLMVPYFSERRATGFTEQVSSQVAFAISGGLQNLVAKIDRCLTSKQLSGPYTSACERVLGFEVTTYPSANGKSAGLEVSAIRHQYIPLQRLGSGVAQALGLIVELLIAEEKIFLIEEIENDLHPTALRALLDLVIRSTERGNQFVISTHSSVVLRVLGGIEGSRVWQTQRITTSLPPESKVVEVASEPSARRALLQSLGYDFSDFDLYDAWLILEESSAERIIREFVIPWFARGLAGRIRTLAAQGASDVEPRFVEMHRLFVFTHLAPAYFERAWVIADGDNAGQDAVNKLLKKFPRWPEEHFQNFSEPQFEKYYPKEFDGRVSEVLNLADKDRRREAKAQLLEDVVSWLRKDVERGQRALAEKAGDVIKRIQVIEQVVTRRGEAA
jgi:predicted ATPase